ncbi:MAG: RtcB family protein [Planctomycetota bacterium]|nr:MAG: RtcB family protein [Planctomycetota bacterium]REJ91423.1 MAG: RtcB family protein [Planctomycetota bacterium]REK18457.1 MAG: RtcB family protein [Planctomycetota bacterium]REK39482.1 MAG: RtcB family protein [Planctomycetota bacterium]
MSALHPKAKIAAWLAEPMPSDVNKSIERLACADDVQHVAVMPDVHLAKDVCIGTVIATSRLIYPSAVGSDIGCGMAAIRFDADADLLSDESAAARVLAGLYQGVPSNKHSAATMPERLPDDLDSEPLSDSRLDKRKRRDGRVQLGTLGRGNHFLEFQADQNGQLWLMVHSGSRAMGQAITAHHLDRVQRPSAGLPHFDSETDEGRAYLADVAWAEQYAEMNRLAIIDGVAGLMLDLFGVGVGRESLIHANHNHVRREDHFGQQLWVHRKGAQSAQLDDPGIIPGSMGTTSYHVAGRGCEQSLCSSSHGAGRRLSRTEAKKSVSRKQLRHQLDGIWYDHRRADALRDEAPAAYKDIRLVMRAQKELTRIIRELRPLLCYKGV